MSDEQPEPVPQAFPCPLFGPGADLVDLFAGFALMGMIAYAGGPSTFEGFARQAYLHADAMMAERAKRQPK